VLLIKKKGSQIPFTPQLSLLNQCLLIGCTRDMKVYATFSLNIHKLILHQKNEIRYAVMEVI